MTHSFLVTIGGAPIPDPRIPLLIVEELADLIARGGGAGAIAAGEPADDGVDTAGDAIVARDKNERQETRVADYNLQRLSKPPSIVDQTVGVVVQSCEGKRGC
jgi:hypothetical protein